MVLQTRRLMGDFSSNNADPIDFLTMRKVGIVAAGEKATEGGFYVNPLYATRVAAQRAAGLAVAHYLFVRPGAGDPAGQVRHFLSVATDIRRRDRVVVDCELDNRARRSFVGMEAGQLRASVSETVAFMERVWWELSHARHSGAVLYTGLSFLQQHGVHLLPPSRRVWMADYGGAGSTVESLWQTCDVALAEMTPWARLWAQQFSGGNLGPAPRTLPGVPGACDVSLLSLPAYLAFKA